LKEVQVMSKLKRVLIPLMTFIVLIAVWQILVNVLKPPKFLLPGPYDIVKVFKTMSLEIWQKHIGFTIQATLLGFLTAIAFGVIAAVGIVSSELINAAITPILVVLQVIPKIAFAPLLLIWFGAGQFSIILITFLVAFFPVVVNMTLGLNEIEPELIDLTRCYHMSKMQVLVKIRFPNAMPYFFSGVKVASTLAVIGAIIGEFVGSNQGLGYLIIIANNNLNTPLAMASILVISIFGLLLYEITVILERISMPWKDSSADSNLKSLS